MTLNFKYNIDNKIKKLYYFYVFQIYITLYVNSENCFSLLWSIIVNNA